MPMHPAITLCYAAYLVVGVVLTILGPLMPELISHFGVTYSNIGAAMVWNSLAYLPAVLLGGFVCGKYGTKQVSIAGFLAMASGYTMIGVANQWWHFITGFCLGGGIGLGLVEAGLNALVMESVREKQGAAMNLLHVYAAIGAVFGPIAARSLVAITGKWQLVYISLAVAFTAIALVFALFRFQTRPYAQTAVDPGFKEMAQSLYHPFITLLAIAMTFYVGAEIGLSNWMYSYFTTIVGGSALLGALLNSVFWIGLGFGRLISARLTEKVGYERFLFYGALAAAIALAPGLLLQLPLVVFVSFFLTGLLFAGTFPTILAVGSQAFPGHNGPVAGVLIFFAGFGTMVFPPAMGYIADARGIWWAMALAFLCVCALVLTTGVMVRRDSKGGVVVRTAAS